MSRSDLRFGAGLRGPRVEDDALLIGQGRFTDDLSRPEQLYAAFLRSSVAHGVIEAVDVAAARAAPGVALVLTAKECDAAGLGDIPPAVLFKGRNDRMMVGASMPNLARERVRYVGEPIAMVVAQTRAQALDALERIDVRIAALPAVPSIEAALAAHAPQLHAAAPGNLCLDWEDRGNDADGSALEAAFARAAHIARVLLVDTRLAPATMEPRAILAEHDAETGRYTLTASTQGVAIMRKVLAEAVLKVPADRVRVLTHEVGGGFGMKSQTYSEYGPALLAARLLGRPVKWAATRLESFLADTHGRDGLLAGEMAFDRDGKMLALRVRSDVGIGAYTTTFAAIFTTTNTKNCLASVYAVPTIHIGVRTLFTNAAPLGPYRGAGRPEAILLVERLIDAAAGALGIDRVELRRRNLIPVAAMPYRTPNQQVYDSGEFAAVLAKALELGQWSTFPQRRAQAQAAGRLRGIGLACFLEVAGGILDESVELRFADDDAVEVITGAQPMGQGHASTFPPMVAAVLGIDAAAVRLVQGDSDRVPPGTPSVASRSIMMAGSATFLACEEALRRGREIAAGALEAASAEIEFTDGRFTVIGTDRGVSLFEVARRARALGAPLDNLAKFVSPQMSFPNGCHVCEVEIDPDTGHLSIERYSAVDDVGRVFHETIVAGQIHGGIVQGLGQVLGEHVRYDADGQLLSGSFMDYTLPRADDVPSLAVAHHSVPCTTNPIGAKGAGESGVAGALPAAVNAVLDALATRGITAFDLPMSAERIWRALRAA